MIPLFNGFKRKEKGFLRVLKLRHRFQPFSLTRRTYLLRASLKTLFFSEERVDFG